MRQIRTHPNAVEKGGTVVLSWIFPLNSKTKFKHSYTNRTLIQKARHILQVER